ncbi:Dicer-like protein 2 [Fusarium falciforme]|nr:Dicer-like protein 2 [Fusarium falciforme]
MATPRSPSPESGSSDTSSVEKLPVEEAATSTPEIVEKVSVIPADDITKASGDEILEYKEESPAPEIINPRAYQREMLEQSLERNVIVAMDTGSGKTQVAVLRIQAELEKCSPDKIIWFLGKTVSLCEQQFKVIQKQNPSVSMKILTGQLNIDAWSPEVWPKILGGTRIIVSTFEILRDALDHGFVKMGMLALIVFDEVHNCVKRSAGRMIMLNFYHKDKSAGLPVPAILGLTASPVISSDLASIEALENTMDAVCTTPTVHREELLQCVNKPHLVRSVYEFKRRSELTNLMRALQTAYQKMDIATDPDVLRFSRCRNEENLKRLRDAIMRNDTFSQNQMKGLWNRSRDILEELGSWAADRYISRLIADFLSRVDAPDDIWSNENRTYLAGYLREVPISSLGNEPPTSADFSHKAAKLIHELLAAGEDVVGIIFVKERTTANVLCDLLNSSPSVQARYRVGAMVGTSSSRSRTQNMYEFNNGASTQILEDFRSGVVNLLVATNVLEEGIDVPACNLVVCFDETTTLKSFIQRRGRARMQESKMIAMESSLTSSRTWEELEESMKRRYQDDQRELERLDELARSEQTDSIYYIIKSSGARLDLDNARQHLEHFCQVVFKADYIDRRPEYIFHKEQNEIGEDVLRAVLTLPSGLPANLRKFRSSSSWKSEKNAMKDAAFRAYVALIEAGLVSENLLPINKIPVDKEEDSDLQPEPLFNPWIQVAQNWKKTEDKWLYGFEFWDEELDYPARFDVALPAELPQLRNIGLYLDADYRWTVKHVSTQKISHDENSSLPDHTSTLLALHFGHRWLVEDREHVIKVIYEERGISRKHIGGMPFLGNEDKAANGLALVRDHSKCPFHYIKTIPSKPSPEEVQHPFYEYELAPQDEPYLVIEKWTRRADLLHPPNSSNQEQKVNTKLYGRVLPISWTTVDMVPKKVVKVGMLIPSIIHEIGVQLVASELSTTLLQPVGVNDLQLVLEAISSRSAHEPVDYERLEFLGDSILKYCTVIQAYAEHPLWPEGLLVHFKDRLVSNARLHRACLESGLSKFILSKAFTGRSYSVEERKPEKWRPLYLDDFLPEESVKPLDRITGHKNLADVVEALIGASFQDGGMEKALKCISVFLSDKCHWHEAGRGWDILFSSALDGVPLPSTLEPLEELIGYSFRKKSLLIEAVTHGSYAGDTHQRSYEQLELLGDAVLDYIIVTKVFNVKPPLPHSDLHLIKTAMVNGEFLAFVNLEHRLRRVETNVSADGVTEDVVKTLALWQFMRYTSPAIGNEQVRTVERFETLRREIVDAIENGTHYPWTLLARFQPKKFYSDLFEALIGAVWVDSGSTEVCEGVLGRFGILPYLERIVRDKVHIKHPKEELSALAGEKKVEYYYTVLNGVEPEYVCRLKVGDRLMADVRGGLNKDEIMTRAAEKAVKILNEEKRAAEPGAEPMNLE